MARLVLGVSGASGIVLAQRALQWLSSQGHTIDLVMTRTALHTAVLEMGPEYAKAEALAGSLPRVHIHRNTDLASTVASGSVPGDGMIIMPCSMASLAAIAVGLSDNLLRRAADVTLKERRRLVIVPRESPFSETHLENMLRITRIGGVIVPPVPAWYVQPQTLADVEEFIVARVCDALGVKGPPVTRWSSALYAPQAG